MKTHLTLPSGERLSDRLTVDKMAQILSLACQAAMLWNNGVLVNRERTLEQLSPYMYKINQIIFTDSELNEMACESIDSSSTSNFFHPGI